MFLALLLAVSIVFFAVQLWRLLFADADLTLLWKEKFGAKPGELSIILLCIHVNLSVSEYSVA
jgi:hypothetical protein